MGAKVNAGSLDAYQYRLHCAIEIVGAIQTAIAEGSTNGESYSDALFGAYLSLVDLSNELRTMIDGAIHSQEP